MFSRVSFVIAASVDAMPSGARIRSRSSSGIGVWVTRSSTAPTSFQPSFEYQKRSPGAVVGASVRRIASAPGPVGDSSVPIGRPLVCVIRWCSVIGPNGSASPSHGSSSLTLTSRSRRPASASWMAMIPANDFEIEPISNRVSGRTGAFAPTSASPRTTTPRTSSASVTARANPAAWVCGRWCSTASPIRSNASSSPGIGGTYAPKNRASSRAADSGESLPCTMFSPISVA